MATLLILTQFLVAFTSDSSYCIWKTKEVTLADTKGYQGMHVPIGDICNIDDLCNIM